MMGPPGSGKGTQSARIAEHFRVPHLSTGALFRAALENDPESDVAKAAAVITNGGLVDDSVVMDVVAAVLTEYDCNVVLDGFPRTTAQAEALDSMLSKNGMKISGMIALDVPQDILKERIKLINEIVKSKNFKELKNENEIRLEHEKTYLPKYFLNSKYPEYYSRKIKTKIENKQITIDLQIDSIRNILEYDKWEK